MRCAHVLLSRMREAYDETGSTNSAIELGVARTASWLPAPL
jgi:hypothetical protein